MGKNYVENSLKRFLKRKMKITMGVVVSFLITGAVAFSEGTTETVKDLEYLLLKNTQENNFCPGMCPEGIKFNPEGETLTLSENDELKLNSENYHNHGTIIGNRWNGIQLYGENPVFCNYGEVIFNKNYGIQISSDTIDAVVYNYGNIESKGNYILSSKTTAISDFYNYGNIKLITSEIPKQFISGKENTTLYNFGSMIALSTNPNAIQMNLYFTKNAYKVINNGYINVYKIQIQTAEEEKFFNNGVILTEKFINAGAGSATPTENTIKNKGIFIVGKELKDTYGDKPWIAFKDNQGAVLQKQDDGTYKLLNTDTLENNKQNETIIAHGVVKDMSKETEINSTNTANNMFINNKSLKLNLGETVKDKVITAVSQKEGNVVLDNNNKEGDENLILDNTTIVGYFEKDGTLLKVDGDLTLTGNSIINAVAARDENGNILTEAVAVDVKGSLTYQEGENHIFGIIKGGENSEITVKPEENHTEGESSSLNENIETSGQLTLEGEEWTKGQGSITLEGNNAEVNIGEKGTGTLTGYLFGDSKDGKTTLDGMITGTGNLNMGRMRFDLGNLDINGLGDTFVIEGSEGIKVQDVINKIEVSGIFNKKTDGNGNLILSLKSAEEMGIYDPSKQKEYEELVKNFKDSEEFYNLVNTGNAEAIRKYLNVLDKVMELLGTAGVKITRDITGAFTDAVVEFDKKANKGEWLTNAKYIGSDMEYDGTKHINGYDSDIKSMIGMAEYGITENTSLGFALGGGDTEVDLKTLNGKSTSFDGKNYYAGIYAKHSMNGFDMTGSLGYTISDLDVEKGGSADSEAVTLAGYIKKDVYVTDTVKLEPNLSFTYDYIMQDKAEMGEGMTIDSGDSHVFEAGAGLNLVKEFALEKGSLKLKTGVKYSMTNIERNKDVTGKFYNADVNLGSPDIDDKEGKAHVGFDYEHETGFGVNEKYEMMWSDSGDDSRITAGISYRF